MNYTDFHERERIERMLRNYMVRYLEFRDILGLLKMITEVADEKIIKEDLDKGWIKDSSPE